MGTTVSRGGPGVVVEPAVVDPALVALAVGDRLEGFHDIVYAPATLRTVEGVPEGPFDVGARPGPAGG